MTNPTNQELTPMKEAQLLPVSQKARDAAAPFFLDNYGEFGATRCLSGGEDGSDLLQAFARFEQSLTTPPEPVDAREAIALEGYRAAAAYIGADSWDGCSDCMEILRAARATDVLHPDWKPDDIANALRDLRCRMWGETRALSTANAPTDALDPIPSSERELLREALEPFGCDDFDNPVADEHGWTEFGMSWCRERIVDWFGPSQFYRARKALASTTREPAPCPSCGGLNTACPDGCGRDPVTGELNGTRLAREPALDLHTLEALTPSGDTKAAYHGEFSFEITETFFDDEADEFTERQRTVYVPWDTVKQIMAAIKARALGRPAQ